MQFEYISLHIQSETFQEYFNLNIPDVYKNLCFLKINPQNINYNIHKNQITQMKSAISSSFLEISHKQLVAAAHHCCFLPSLVWQAVFFFMFNFPSQQCFLTFANILSPFSICFGGGSVDRFVGQAA